MGIIIKGENKGIYLNGNVTINSVDFQLGEGVKSVSGILQETTDSEEDEDISFFDELAKRTSTKRRSNGKKSRRGI